MKEAWLSFHENAPTNSCIEFQTAECRAILELCLCDMVQSADCPVVIAWDDEKEKVSRPLKATRIILLWIVNVILL